MSLELTQEIKDKIKEIVKANPNLNSVGLGEKVSGGIATGESAIVCSVTQKKPIEELSPEEILPYEITVGDQVIKIDVIEASRAYQLGCTTCGGWSGASSGQFTNRQFTRPLRSGITMSSDRGWPGVGTLGTIVKDTATGVLLGLTNNHVTIENPNFTSDRNLLNPADITNDYDPVNNVYQATEGQTGYISPVNIVGRSVRYAPTYYQSSGIANKVDAALFSIQQTVIDNKSWQPIGLDTILPNDNPQFATTLELDNLFATNPKIWSSGRTSGARGETICGNLRVNSVGITLPVSASAQGPTWVYEDVIAVIRPDDDTPTSQQIGCLNPGLKGDSGSAVYAEINGTIKLIGLLFAGTCTVAEACCGFSGPPYGCSSVFFVCRIDHIADELGIEHWNPNVDQLRFVKTSTMEYVTEAGGSNQRNKSCEGKTYWQAGLTDTLDNPC
jgi:hypothetical protein